jgi:hypothetical protein
MVGRTSDWKAELGRWLKPFLERLGHKAHLDYRRPETRTPQSASGTRPISSKGDRIRTVEWNHSNRKRLKAGMEYVLDVPWRR